MPTYFPMIIALISFKISFREGTVDGTILFRVRKPRPVSVVRDNGSAGHFSLARSDGVLDDWSIGKTLTGYSARKAQDRSYATFWILKTLLTIPDHYSSTPLLQQPRDLRAGFWPPSRGLQTKPRPLGVDSLQLKFATSRKKRK